MAEADGRVCCFVKSFSFLLRGQPPQEVGLLLHAEPFPAEIIQYSQQELHRFTAINNAMIVGKCYVHHGPDFDLSTHHNRPLLDLVHAQNTNLRRIPLTFSPVALSGLRAGLNPLH